jgi:hypothetical protein
MPFTVKEVNQLKFVFHHICFHDTCFAVMPVIGNDSATSISMEKTPTTTLHRMNEEIGGESPLTGKLNAVSCMKHLFLFFHMRPVTRCGVYLSLLKWLYF